MKSTIVGAGNASGALDLANMLSPAGAGRDSSDCRHHNRRIQKQLSGLCFGKKIPTDFNRRRNGRKHFCSDKNLKTGIKLIIT